MSYNSVALSNVFLAVIAIINLAVLLLLYRMHKK
jgi:cbb3-type cytochrome oxidase subunit 3